MIDAGVPLLTPAGREWRRSIEATRREIGDRRLPLGVFGPERIPLVFGRSPLHGFDLFAGRWIPRDTEIMWPDVPGKRTPAAEMEAFLAVDASFNMGLDPSVPNRDRGAVAVAMHLSFETPRGNLRSVQYANPRRRLILVSRVFADRAIEEGEELLVIVNPVVVEVSSIWNGGKLEVAVETDRKAWSGTPPVPEDRP